MGYFDQLDIAADWLAAAQNPDHGWGMSHGQASSIVNTAEAIYVLTRAHRHDERVKTGLEFIQTRLFPAIEKQGPRTRYVFFALFGLLDHTSQADPLFVSKCVDWLLQARNKDGAWGHEANDQASRVFPTCMALICLAKLEKNFDGFEMAYNWLISKAGQSGWSFEDGKGPQPTATALAVLALRQCKDQTEEVFTRPKEFLLQTTYWGTERENIPGTLWEHCSYSWIFAALVSLGVNPYEPVVAQGVREVNRLAHNGGWIEPSGGQTIRGQFWAVMAFDALHRAFDPAIHIYRIDSERAQSVLSEPEFVNIKVRNSRAMVIPRGLYRLCAYLLLGLSFLIFLGVHRFVNAMPRVLDLVLSVLCFLCVYFLVKKRKHLFPARVIWVISGIVAVLGLLDLAFGLNVKSFFDLVNGYLSTWWSK